MPQMPRTPVSRLLGVMLVASSMYLVSVFTAQIASVMTVDAIIGSIYSVNDLYGKEVGTISVSTLANFSNRRKIEFTSYPDLQEVLTAVENDELSVPVFGAPILS